MIRCKTRQGVNVALFVNQITCIVSSVTGDYCEVYLVDGQIYYIDETYEKMIDIVCKIQMFGRIE